MRTRSQAFRAHERGREITILAGSLYGLIGEIHCFFTSETVENLLARRRTHRTTRLRDVECDQRNSETLTGNSMAVLSRESQHTLDFLRTEFIHREFGQQYTRGAGTYCAYWTRDRFQ